MRKTLLAISAIFVCSASLAGCATNQRSPSYQLEQQNVSAINWMQLSGEYDALAYQAFNGARRAFDAAKPAKGRKKAVIVDLDETMIDNTAYAGWRVRQGVPFTEETWARWMAAGQARPIAGAVEFARHVNANGGTMFYVTNRDARLFQSTAANIEKLGFPGVSAKTLLLNSGQSNKQERFDSIKAEGYDCRHLYGGQSQRLRSCDLSQEQPAATRIRRSQPGSVRHEVFHAGQSKLRRLDFRHGAGLLQTVSGKAA
ncbi:5'-nucleotidase, lipoprotein e(P4) family [Brucella sp. ZJ1_1]|uniref:5'-nucleotidase, lipoprotein e(P4) family n=1 Tax=Brucella intermedia GD04153 TaxID=2975438 RepID=A0AA42GVT9_9HYPH|nr:HAD family acid phosphatase [Brucella intermedia]MDH0123344.1 5'-nucleotidase, lipoprotein e(P4) family [Brucella intermedia GD04153]